MIMGILDDILFSRGVNVVFLKKNDCFLLLTKDKKHIIELKDVAFSIWQNLQEPISFADLLKKIKEEYNVSEEELTKDLKSWLKEALKEKIIEKRLKT